MTGVQTCALPILITGASTGLGLAMAKEFAASGASVALLARKADVLASAKAEVQKAAGKSNGRFEAYSCDVSKAQPIIDTIKKVQTDLGKVDILVNNAGISHAKPFDTVTDEDWQGDLDLKLFAAIRGARCAIPHMKKQGGGRIINVTSAMVKSPRPHQALSTSARTGLTAFSKSLSFEVAVDNVTINNMLPERIDTDRQRFMAERMMQELGIDMAEARRRIADGIAAKRFGTPKEFGDACAFLCSVQASFISGQNLQIDGGSYPGLI